MLKPFFTMLFVVESILLIAQTDNKGTPQHVKRTIVKEGVKMYELKADSNSGVRIVDPKSSIADKQQHHSVLPTSNDTTQRKP
ncbi:MAG: hypothetical protein JNL95_02840 [Chitinophagales bacterium]|nr:hypothetical protein [Chitinophagales bacterium]